MQASGRFGVLLSEEVLNQRWDVEHQGHPGLNTIFYMDNRIKEMEYSLPWIAKYPSPRGPPSTDLIAAFLIVRNAYSYMSAGNYEQTRFWFTDKYQYGEPLSVLPTRTNNSGTVTYTRVYEKATITLTCHRHEGGGGCIGNISEHKSV